MDRKWYGFKNKNNTYTCICNYLRNKTKYIHQFGCSPVILHASGSIHFCGLTHKVTLLTTLGVPTVLRRSSLWTDIMLNSVIRGLVKPVASKSKKTRVFTSLPSIPFWCVIHQFTHVYLKSSSILFQHVYLSKQKNTC